MLSYQSFLTESNLTSYKLTDEEQKIALDKLSSLQQSSFLWKGELQHGLVSCHDIGFSREPMFLFNLESEDSRDHLGFVEHQTDPRKCIPQQMTCVIKKLKEYIQDNRNEISQCIWHNGKIYALDHHRIAVQILAGRQSIPVEVAPLPDEYFQPI